MKKLFAQIFTALFLFTAILPAQAALKADPGSDHCEDAALTALLESHQGFKAWDVVKKLKWDSTGKSAVKKAFPSEVRVSVPASDPIEHFTVAYPLGTDSYLRLGVQRSGKICLLLSVAKKNKDIKLDKAIAHLTQLTENVLDGKLTQTFDIQPLEQTEQQIAMIYDGTDSDLSPGVEGTSANGRDIFLQSALAYLAEFSPDLAKALAPTAKVKKEAGKSSVAAPATNVKALSRTKTVDAVHNLGDKLVGHIAAANPADRNFFFSAPSVAFAWGAASAGAEGDTAKEMLGTFGIDGDANDATSLVMGLGELMTDLFPAGDTSVVGANAVFMNPRFPLNETYKSLLETKLRAIAENLFFGTPGAAERINAWVKEKTLEMIPKLIDETDSLDIAYLISVVALQVKWETQFDPDFTEAAPFLAADGSTVEVQMMRRDASFNYGVSKVPGNGAKVQGVSLPTTNPDIVVDFWSVDGRKPSPDALVALAKPSAIAELAQDFEAGKKGLFELPRLKVEYDTDLIEALKAAGAELPFGEADFSRMAPGPIYLSKALQKSALELEETGVKAAAATVIVATRRSVSLPEAKFHLRLDQPFVIAIRNTKTGVVKFTGIMNKPSDIPSTAKVAEKVVEDDRRNGRRDGGGRRGGGLPETTGRPTRRD